jgi:hypothetical protein
MNVCKTIFLQLFLINSIVAQNLITSDLENFKYIFENLKTAKTKQDTIDLIQTQLVEKASPTFKEYLEYKRTNGSDIIQNYLFVLRNFPKYYKSVLNQSQIFYDKNQIKKIENAYKRLGKVYPKAKLLPNVICIGFMDDGGKSLNNGQFIGLEMFACNNKADKSELSDSKRKSYLEGASYNLEKIDEVITHELIHLSQFKGDKNFAKTFKGTIKFIPLISEGGAAFVTDYLYNFKATFGPGVFYKEQWDYCNANESKLWQDFLIADNFASFFWEINSKYPVPRIGYYLGYKVCKAYFDKAKDKKQAINEIIEVTDWDNFVKKSGFIF